MSSCECEPPTLLARLFIDAHPRSDARTLLHRWVRRGRFIRQQASLHNAFPLKSPLLSYLPPFILIIFSPALLSELSSLLFILPVAYFSSLPKIRANSHILPPFLFSLSCFGYKPLNSAVLIHYLEYFLVVDTLHIERLELHS
ncbi:hypothetical protein AMECASPLE_010479 [Ameca splendens]|uniref:Uncharacterized protein n=1 Tax=Ameca splendens TaxID=208324 RepID=A0ABV0YBQ0_9TELE